MIFHPDDYNLTLLSLVGKYSRTEEHPQYTKVLWNNADKPYWPWVQDQLIAEKAQLKTLTQTVMLDSTATTAVDINYHWQPMLTCPRGCKVQLKGAGGVAVYGQFNGNLDDEFWVGWAPLPTTKKD